MLVHAVLGIFSWASFDSLVVGTSSMPRQETRVSTLIDSIEDDALMADVRPHVTIIASPMTSIVCPYLGTARDGIIVVPATIDLVAAVHLHERQEG